MFAFEIRKHVFQFKNPSGTSRGVLTEKCSWIIDLWDEENHLVIGKGECSIIEGLSPDFESSERYESMLNFFLQQFCKKIDRFIPFSELAEEVDELKKYPSILFGIEAAFLDLQTGGNQLYFDNDFTHGKLKIPINGLIWMGTKEFMLKQIDLKIAENYSCIKMKIGAIDFGTEYEILKSIRAKHPASQLILRVDANGAFEMENAAILLEKLRELDIHSIEQPIKAGNWEGMADLCSQNILPIALDEELIGVVEKADKKILLETIKPQFIILKPSLHGGLGGVIEWIELAENLSIPWWITSALESNIGLNVIAQFVANYPNLLHQGLGTGALYVNNFETKLKIEQGFMSYNLAGKIV
jgi:L-alanine-DL-glutamate epimerase-like enolase superfamily enzyme